MVLAKQSIAISVVCLAALVACSLVACSLVAYPAWAAAEKSSGDKQAASGKTATSDPFAVPNGDPEELVAYINKLAPMFFHGDAKTKAKARQAIVTAAGKILAANPNDAQCALAVDAKMHLLTDEKQLTDFADELSKRGHEKASRQVRTFVLKKNLGHAEAAGPEGLKRAIENTVAFVEAAPPQRSDSELADWLVAAANPELTNDPQFALATYGRLAHVFSADPAFKGLARRLSLPGHRMQIEGRLVGGGKFDWSKYAGKVVLVDFWATWCGPCVAEIPEIRKCYKLYHNRGFEVVGISRDHQLSDLEHFVKEKKIPWANVFGDGRPSRTYEYYGVAFTPTMILVGKDGNVASMFVRGSRLREQLTKLLGPVEEKESPEKKRPAA